MGENAWLWFYGVGAFAMNQLLKIAGFVVGRSGLPALPEDADPLKGQRANDGCMFFALFEHVLVVNFSPLRIADGLSRPFDKGLPQKNGRTPTPMGPDLVSTFSRTGATPVNFCMLAGSG